MITNEEGIELKIQNGSSFSLNEQIPYPDAFRTSYVNQKLGALICWNMSTFVDAEYANPNLNVDTFYPSGIDTNNWLDSVVSMGGKYAILTTKHHDGFAIWDTSFAVSGCPVYGISQTSWYSGSGSPDIVGMFVESCRSHKINPGLYFSIRDYTYEARSVTTQVSNTAAYIAMIKAQLAELLTNYGHIDVIWFDGWGWDLGYSYITYSEIFNFVKSIDPRTIVVENAHVHPSVTSEIETYEQNETPIAPGNTRLSEAVQSSRIDGRWFFDILEDQTINAYSGSTTGCQIANANDNFGTFLLGITVDKTGHIPSGQATFLSQIPGL